MSLGEKKIRRRRSVTRHVLDLIESGIEAERRKGEQLFALVERFRNETDSEAATRLGDELGRLVFTADAADLKMGPPAGGDTAFIYSDCT